jgi:hypothetical protein
MKGRLNLFQATMLRWRDLHPYNAVHVVRIDLPLDRARLQRDLDAVLAAQGLTGFTLDVARRRYEFTGGPPHSELRVLAGGQDPAAVVRDVIEREINTPFPHDGSLEPFRFFAVDAGTSFHLVLAYDHVVAGGDSIAGLLTDFVERYTGSATATAPPPDLYPPSCARLLARNAGYVLRGLSAIPPMIASARRSLRPRYPRGNDPQNAFASLRIGKEGMAAMAGAASTWGVTRNDLLMALLLAALAPLAGEARHHERRRELGVASIVNVRRDFGANVRGPFGQFLSSFRYSHPVPDGISLRELARDLHAETERVKRRKLYLQTLLALAGVGMLWPWLSPSHRAGIHAKNYPVWVGITPLDVDRLWRKAGGRAPPAEYLRAVSTGPTAPLVVATTTAGGTLHLGLSYRTTAFTGEDVAKIAAGILDGVEHLDA